MPYTPPSRRSPEASTANTPIISRNQSYAQSTKHQNGRPDLPRSRSAVYISKHRRSPSLLAQSQEASAIENVAAQVVHEFLASPTKVGFTSSSTESSDKNTSTESSSQEEDEERGRSRQIQVLAESLKESFQIPRAPSPKSAKQSLPLSMIQKLQQPIIGALTAEAKKIAHSRSSSELIPLSSVPLSSEALADSDEDNLEMRRAPLLRKKSGELVRPALRGSSQRRPSSAPGTPTYPKAVHFGEQIEQVRHFLQVDRPIAVSAGSSPVEVYDSETDFPFETNVQKKPKAVEWEIKLTNFPEDTHERKCQPVRVEQLYLTKDYKFLMGIVAVANIAFEKWVAARFTLDYWKTTSEVSAEFSRGKQLNDGFDRFQFSIKLSDLANLQNKTMYLCVRYNTNGSEHWDSNCGNNYQVDFIRKGPAKVHSKPAPIVAGIPRSRQSSSQKMPRPRSFPSTDDEFNTSFDSPYRLRNLPKEDDASEFVESPTTAANRLSNRYDFSASLHAALTTAQNALGERSGLKIKTDIPLPAAPQQITQHQQSSAPILPRSNHSRTPSRPDVNSQEYKELIQKFCYFGADDKDNNEPSALGIELNPQPVEPLKELGDAHQVDGAHSGSNSTVSSIGSSPSQSPPSPQFDENAQAESTSISSSRSSSAIRGLSPKLIPYRQPSPGLNSAFQEFSHQSPSVQLTSC